MSWLLFIPIGLMVAGLASLAPRTQPSTPPAPPMPLPNPDGALPTWDDDDIRALPATANVLRMAFPDLMLVLYAESRLNWAAVNRNAAGIAQAVGLNQLTQGTATGLGITTPEWLLIPTKKPSIQLPNYVTRYFQSLNWYQNGKFFRNATQIYFANAAPGRMLNPISKNDPVYRRGDGAYENNTGLDGNKDGVIDAGDLDALLRRLASEQIFVDALARANRVLGTNLSPTFL